MEDVDTTFSIETDNPVNFTLSRDAETGAVTIRYSSPEDMPVKFSWTATVAVDGTVTGTPFTIDAVVDPDKMSRNTAKYFVADAAKAMDVNLNGDQTEKAVALVAEFGTKMSAKNLAAFARFVVQIRLTDASTEKDRTRAKDMSESIRAWRDVTAGDGQFAALEGVIRDYANDDLAVARGRPDHFDQDDPNIYSPIRKDADRNSYVVGGQKVPNMGNADGGNTLIAAIKQVLPEGKAHKVATILMNQESVWHVKFPQSRISFDFRTGDKKKVDFAAIPGADKIINSNYMGGLYETSIDGVTAVEYRLDAASDGKTAKITIAYQGKMISGYGKDVRTEFGTYSLTEELTIDLTKDEPDVIDVMLAQTFDA